MRITVRQLRTLIREAVEDASGEQLYDPSLGLEEVTSSREAANGTIALLDPETGDKYKITRGSRYVRLYKTEWEVMAGKRPGTKSRYNDQQPILMVSPKDVADDAEFVEYAYERITQYVNKRRASLGARQKTAQFYNDRVTAMDRRSGKRTADLTPEEAALETDAFEFPNTKGNPFRTPEFQAHQERYVDYWKNK